MSKLRISDQLLLPKDTVTSTLIVYGGKGMGKTNFGAVLVEELSKLNLRWCALDPLGVWWGLRYSQDAKNPGIECVILGGSHADFPIEPTGGAIVADMVIDETANFIIDFSRKPSGEMWSIGEKVRFITDYAYRLFQRQGELIAGVRREPIFQLLDEAARYIPQIIPAGNPQLAMCVAAWEQLVEEGRNIGIGVGLLTQRSARMNKSVSEVADAILSFRIVGPNSIGAIMDWLGEHVPKERIKVMIEQVRSLERGSCLVVSPGWLQFEGVIKIRERQTFDSSATPKPGERARRVSGEGAKPDLAKYADRMKASIERAKANDPKELKAEVARLKAELAKKHAPVKTESTAADPRAIERAVKAATAPLLKRISDLRRAATPAMNALAGLRATFDEEIPEPQVAVDPAPAPAPVRIQTPTVRTVPAPTNGDASLSNSQKKVLSRLVELLECTNQASVKKEQLAAWAEYSPTSGGYNNLLGALRSRGLIDYPQPGMVAITAGGRALASPDEISVSSDEMREHAKRVLGGSEARLLDILHRSRNTWTKEQLGQEAGFSHTSGGFNNYLGHMRTLGFVEYPAPGQVKAADWLYL